MITEQVRERTLDSILSRKKKRNEAAKSGAITGCLRNDVAVGWGQLSVSSNQQIASRFLFSAESHLQYYGGMVKTYCGKKNKSEKLKSKHLSPLNDRPLSDKGSLNLLKFISKDVPALATTPTDASASLTEQVRAEIISDAVNAMMRQLGQAKAECKQRKRQFKAQKKALKSTEKQRKSKGRFEDSSSSSFDSEAEVIDMTRLQRNEGAKSGAIKGHTEQSKRFKMQREKNRRR